MCIKCAMAKVLNMSDDIVIRVENLTKAYRLYNSNLERMKESFHPLRRKYSHEFNALHDVTFDVKKGETFGIIGRNGSGKSTLLKIVSGVLTPTKGVVTVNGRISALLELGAGFNLEMTGMENVYFNGTLMGYARDEIDTKLDAILAFADIGEFIHQPVKVYSSGMFVRLAFALAINVDPNILIVDEALAVGDVFFQQKCYKRLRELKQQGVTILFVTHGMGDIVQHCQRTILLNDGKIEFHGDAAEAAKRYFLLQQHERLAAYTASIVEPDLISDDSLIKSKDFYWPPIEQFLDISKVDSVSNSNFRCTLLALCNCNCVASTLYSPGDILSIYCEFELNSAIEVPIGGFLIKNEKNIMVHGKNSLHYDDISLPVFVPSNGRVRFKFDVYLDISPGEYTVDVGLATISKNDYEKRIFNHASHTQSKVLRLCNLSNAASFSVIQKPIQSDRFNLLHVGVCNLQGSSWISIENIQRKPIVPKSANSNISTIFHVTHWKAGSQWINNILHEIAPERYVKAKVGVGHFLTDPIISGMIYPTVYVTKEQFESVKLPDSWQRFIVIRDLRDTLISGYFSLKVSHSVVSSGILSFRDKLNELSIEEGLIYLIDEWLHFSAAIQRSWLGAGDVLIKYEDLLNNDLNILTDVLIRKCKLDILPVNLEKIINDNRFEKLTGGRMSGCEDINAHERKGVAGDWRNYFTAKVKWYFKEKYGDLLLATGYVQDENW